MSMPSLISAAEAAGLLGFLPDGIQPGASAALPCGRSL